MASKKEKLGEWDLSDILQGAAHGDPVMKNLKIQNFINTYQRMSALPDEVNVKKIVRGNGIPFLAEFLYEEHLVDLKKIFMAGRNDSLTKEKLKDWLLKNVNNKNLMEQYDKIFNLIDLDLDGVISWTEMLGFLEKEMIERNHLVNGYIPPFIGDYIQGPTVQIENRHKRLIAALVYWPSVRQNRSQEVGSGKYVSVSDRGDLDFYNLDMEHISQATAPSAWPPTARNIVKTMCVLPELNILCLAYLGRELSFYDCKNGKTELVYHITNLDSHPVEMLYHFYENPERESYIAIGGMDGSVDAILFRTDGGGPFKRQPGQPFVTMPFLNIRMDRVPGVKLHAFRNHHTKRIETLRHLDSLGCLLSTSNCNPGSLVLLDVHESCVLVKIEAPLGITCADLLPPPPVMSPLAVTGYEKPTECLERQTLDWWMVTGGLDTRLRVWDLNDTRRPRFTLQGHISRIKFIIVQNSGLSGCPLIISYGRIGRINVWNARTFENLQLYTAGLSDLPEDKPLAHCYNSHYQLLLLCTYKILSLKLGKYVDKCVTSGTTEVEEIVNVLYNQTYQMVITTTLGSVITIWNAETGDKYLVLPKCHVSKSDRGEKVYGISAAIFNPAENVLATGAVDGSIKLWNFYRGVSFITFMIPGPLRWLFWLEYGLMAVTNDGRVRIYPSRPRQDSGYSEYSISPHTWAANFVSPSYLVVGTLDGKLLFKDFATGRTLREYVVMQPERPIPVSGLIKEHVEAKNQVFDRDNYLKCGGTSKMRVEFVQLLGSRPEAVGVGNLLVSLQTGVVQFWSTHPQGGYVTSFYAVHLPGDSVMAFCSNSNDTLLFIGTIYGYLKLWWVGDFGLGPLPGRGLEGSAEHPFLSAEFGETTAAEVAAREESTPTLLNCYRGHSGSIRRIYYFDRARILMTAATRTVRFWTLTGQFLNSLGCNLPWIHYSLTEPQELKSARIPSDLKRIVSDTSLKIVTNDYGSRVRRRSGEAEALGREHGPAYGKPAKTERSGGKVELPPDIPWKRADLTVMWQRMETAESKVAKVPPLPDLAQEQLYQNIPFHRTEKVTWIKPPKIIRSRRRRMELTIENREKIICCECAKEEKERSKKVKLQYNKGISLGEGVKLRAEERKRRERKKKCDKCYWKVQNKKYDKRIDSLFDEEFLGNDPVEMVNSFGRLVKAASGKRLGEACLFGRQIPSSENDMEKFISDVMEAKGIDDSPQNKQLLTNLIKIEKKKAIVKDLEGFEKSESCDLIEFDCFTEKEMSEALKKAQEFEGREEAGRAPGESRSVSGVYSLISSCLLETKYREASDEELLALLGDLAKRPDGDSAQAENLTSYKKRFQWWKKLRDANKVLVESKNFPKLNEKIEIFVRNIVKGDSKKVNFQDDFYKTVSENLAGIIKRERCPQCGELPEIKSDSLLRTDVGSEKSFEAQKNVNSLIKHCLVTASMGEIREEDALNELGKFAGRLIGNTLPFCKTCHENNKTDNGKQIERKVLKQVDQVIAFCKPRDLPYQSNLESTYQRSSIYFKRKEDCERMKKQATLQQEREININRYERKAEFLRNEMGWLAGHDEASKEKRADFLTEIKAITAKIREEYARGLEE